MLNDSVRTEKVRQQLRVGMRVRFSLSSGVGETDGIIVSLKRSRALITNLADGKDWDMPICSINLGGALPSLPKSGSRSTRDAWRVGDQVGFLDRDNQELHGVIEKLNPKTASVATIRGKWKVSYSYLFLIMDTSASSVTGHRLTVDRDGTMTILVDATPAKD